MKHEILEGKKITDTQKSVLHVMSDSNEKNYILEIFDINTLKSTYTLTNGSDDFKDIRESTFYKLISFCFLRAKTLPSSDKTIRTKYFIPNQLKVQVFCACL